jgi:hypothetical protein
MPCYHLRQCSERRRHHLHMGTTDADRLNPRPSKNCKNREIKSRDKTRMQSEGNSSSRAFRPYQ